MDGKAVTLEVEDNGPGLTPQQLDRAALRMRGSSAPARALSADQETGFGLGLAITAEIAALFGAEIQVQNVAEGHGVLARIRFPALPL
jgi:two-component system sensor histidine kinase TctE